MKQSVFFLVAIALLLPATPTQAQIHANGWQFACEDLVEVEHVGMGTYFDPNPVKKLSLGDSLGVREVFVTAVCKYGCPSSITFSSAKGSVVANGQPILFPGSNWPQPMTAYSAHLPHSEISSITASGAYGWYFEGVYAQVFRNSLKPVSSYGIRVNLNFHHNQSTLLVPLPTASEARDIEIVLPVTDLNGNGRSAIFVARAGAAYDSVAASNSDPALGNYLRFVRLNLTKVDPQVTQLSITLRSPSPYGESFFVAGAVSVGISCPVNLTPVAVSDINVTLMNTAVEGNALTNDYDPDGHTLSMETTPVDGPSHGAVLMFSNGTYLYSPNPGFTGKDVFSYRVCDNGIPNACAEAQVSISVLPAATGIGPIAHDDAFKIEAGSIAVGNLLANDLEPEGNPSLLHATLLKGASNGIASLTLSGDFVYIPFTGFEGTDTLRYQACNTASPARCSEANVFISVLPVYPGANRPPVAVDDAFETRENTLLSANLSLNDFEPDNEPLLYNIVPLRAPMHGTLSLQANGTFSYLPHTGYTGPDFWTYAVCDNNGVPLCASATAMVLVFPAVLPTLAVDWLSVGAVMKGADVELSWRVTGELSGDLYHVERSADGSIFEVVAAESGRQAGAAIAAYSYLDPSLRAAGALNMYYRITAISADGSFSQSPVVQVWIDPELRTVLELYPNPARGNPVTLQYALPGSAGVTVELLNPVNQTVYRQQLSANNGALLIPSADLAPGLYVLKIFDRYRIETRKLLVN